MVLSWDEKASQVVDLLCDGNWHDVGEVEKILSIPREESDKIMEMSEDAAVVELRRKDGELSQIRRTETLENFKNLPEEE